MFITHISPRFAETDALGHINNTVVPVWFEQARAPVFRFFTPDLDFKKWKLIVAKIEVEYKGELVYGHEVTLHTYLSHIGNSSLVITQEAYQQEKLCARGNATLVHFDYHLKKSSSIPDDIRKLLHEHLVQ
jgi:acyl-CoA thioester hydrolase